MYRNIGGKIKGLARVLCTIGIIFSVLIAILLCGLGIASGEETAAIVCIIGGVIYILLGILMAWLSTIMLYAFGQQVEMQEKSAVLLEKIYNAMGSCRTPAPQPVIPSAPKYEAPKPAPQPVIPPAPKFETQPVCPKCGAQVSEGAAFCTTCGNKM